MAAKPAAKSFDDIIKSDRKKRKAEALAQQIFGKKSEQRQSGRPDRSVASGASLASRVGITKRSASSSSIDRQTRPQRPNPPSSLSRAATAARLESHVAQNDRAPRGPRETASNSAPVSGSGEISIRGAAGPYTVVAQNFAPGTTAADIESVMQPIGGDMLSCRLQAARPTVVAEMVFSDKQGADNVIATFNNKKADGRLLYVFMKTPADPIVPARAPEIDAGALGSSIANTVPTQPGQPAPIESGMEVDVPPNGDGYRDTQPRAEGQAGRNGRYDDYYDQRNAQPTYQDGRYGYAQDSRGPTWDNRRDYRGGRGGGGGGGGGRLYSDNMDRRSGPRRGW